MLFDKLDIDPVDLKMKDTEKVLAYYEFLKTKNERSGDENMDFEVLSKMVVSDKKVDEIVEEMDNYTEIIEKLDEEDKTLREKWIYKLGFYCLGFLGVVRASAANSSLLTSLYLTTGYFLYKYSDQIKKCIVDNVISKESSKDVKKYMVKQISMFTNTFIYYFGMLNALAIGAMTSYFWGMIILINKDFILSILNTFKNNVWNIASNNINHYKYMWELYKNTGKI